MRLDDYYMLGRSGLRVSRLALGAMTFGTEWGWGADESTAREAASGRALGAVLATSMFLAGVPDETKAAQSEPPEPSINRVTFDSDGIKLVGNLYLPGDHREGRRLPAVVVVGSLTSVKEQMSGLYARRLAERGFIALAFDYRNFGESDGEPRQYESPTQHIADIRNAVSFLTTSTAVDAQRIAGLGICTGGAYMGVATATDPRIKAYAAVASHLASEQTNLLLYGGRSGVEARREAGRQAMSRYRNEGHIDYLLAYSNRAGDPTASHSGPMEYYFDASRGYILPWTNRFAVMSWEEWLDFSALPAAKDIRVPSLIIHGDNAALPANAKIFFEKIGTPNKQLVWTGEPHFDFYDREASLMAAETVAEHFQGALESVSETTDSVPE